MDKRGVDRIDERWKRQTRWNVKEGYTVLYYLKKKKAFRIPNNVKFTLLRFPSV